MLLPLPSAWHEALRDGLVETHVQGRRQHLQVKQPDAWDGDIRVVRHERGVGGGKLVRFPVAEAAATNYSNPQQAQWPPCAPPYLASLTWHTIASASSAASNGLRLNNDTLDL